jgi:hypothetical protein
MTDPKAEEIRDVWLEQSPPRMNRDEHMAFCKSRALKYLETGDTQNALTSMFSDLGKHPETANHSGTSIGLGLMMIGNLSDVESARRFIEGFR